MFVINSIVHRPVISFKSVKVLSAVDKNLIKVKFCTFMMSNQNPDDLLLPPKAVEGMQELDKNAFKKTVIVPCLDVEPVMLSRLNSVIKKYLLKMIQFQPVKVMNDNTRRLLFNPVCVKNWHDFDQNCRETLESLQITEHNLKNEEIKLGYENWSAEVILKAVVPKDEEPLTSYSIVGHIVHVNIKEHLLKYKNVIGQVLLDKVRCAKTVVNKTTAIDNTYRNFQMELLCGESNMLTQVTENHCKFEFDYSTVYWNSRLSTEHERVVKEINPYDVLFDVFCGVGPFSIPAAKKKCYVYANDLNPESFKWLNHNVKLNKVNTEFIKTVNKDGGDFISNEMKSELIRLWSDESFNRKIHVTMNLPALSLEFVKFFKGLFIKDEVGSLNEDQLPVIYLYFFVSHEEPLKVAYDVFTKATNLKLDDYKVVTVRNVSRNKDMMKITFRMPYEFLVNDGVCQKNESDGDFDEPKLKKLCT